jgi:tetratricopeptide (TPR) repeat protein
VNEAISLLRELVKYPTPEGSENAVYLQQLALSLYLRSVRSGSISDINEAIRLTTEVLEHRPLGHPDRAEALQGLATAVLCRAQISTSTAVADVDKTVHLCRDALGLRPPGDVKRGPILNSLSLCLIFRFEAQQNVHDLDEATSLCRESLPLHPPGGEYHIRTLKMLATVLQLQPKHLDEALQLSRKSVSLIGSTHSDRWEHLMTLASILHQRYKRSGAVVDLEEALTICAKAMALCPPKHIRRHKLVALQANLAEH